ncbi:MAG TPA: hypothetical protein VE242_11910 [Chthoniobacterales bacterium]|nr:hypothetical protein [Chthoniobacterales bacterium]
MLRLLLLFSIPSLPVQAVELLRDRHGSEEYIVEADQTEMTATVDAAEATVRATDWATHFYGDLLHVEDCEFRNRPIRFWLVSFVRSGGSERVYAVLPPDGTIVEPHTLTRS